MSKHKTYDSLLGDLRQFASSNSSSRGGLPRSPNQESLIDPLLQAVVPGPESSQNGPTTQSLLQQLLTESQVLTGVTGAGTQSSGGGSVLNTITGLLGGGGSGGSLLGSIFGGGFGLSPLISGILSLFGGGGTSAPAPLVPFQMPSSVQFQGGIDGPGGGGLTAVDYGQNGQPRNVGQSGSQSGSQQVTIQVSAMDSKSFLDHSDDIARAVRQAMLTSNTLNDVVAGI